jgi:hypothetical protein
MVECRSGADTEPCAATRGERIQLTDSKPLARGRLSFRPEKNPACAGYIGRLLVREECLLVVIR